MNSEVPGSNNLPASRSNETVITTLSYLFVLVVYIVLGYNFKTIFLNWIVGPLFLVITLYYIPFVVGFLFKRKETTN